MDMSEITKAIGSIEGAMAKQAEQAKGQLETLGKVTADTKTALENLGKQQHEIAARLAEVEQRGAAAGNTGSESEPSVGEQLVKAAGYADFVAGRMQRVRVEAKNTITNTVGNTFSERQPGIVGGAFREFTLENLLTTLPTSSNAIDYLREGTFTNAAAETAEAAAKPESSVTTALVTEPVATVAHWLKISRQLAADNAALVAYTNTRMIYGVNLRVENQIVSGNGTSPNMSGFTKTGNFTAHGYTAASLGAAGLSATNRFDLIGAIIGDTQANDYPADTILLNPADWWKLRLTKDTTGRYILGDPGATVAPRIHGLPVVASNAIPAGKVLVAALRLSATFYNRESVVVDMSESDSDNFTKNLVTVRAERRCMLAVERPAAVRYGDLVPA